MIKIGAIICGKYKVAEVLGQGGMSHVYLVEDMKLQKIERLKKSINSIILQAKI